MKKISVKLKKYFTILVLLTGFINMSVLNASVSAQEDNVFRLSQTLGEGASDSIGWYWQQNNIFSMLTYRALTVLNPSTGEQEPDLASEFTMSEDGLVYDYVLKDDLKWSDGEPLTTEDVKHSIETSLKVAVINGIFPENFSKIVGAQDFIDGNADEITGVAIDGQDIEITLESPIGMFANVVGEFVIYPKHVIEDMDPLELHNSDFLRQPVTNGMYQVEEINAGNYIRYTLNPYYEGEEPKIKEVLLSYINDPVLAMQDEQSHFHTTNRIEEINQLDGVENLEKFPIDILFYRYFLVNLSGRRGEGDSVLADPLVREALMYGIDRETIVGALLQGTANVLNTGVPTNFEEYYEEADTYTYDKEKAIEMLNEANFDFDRTVKILYYYNDQNSIDFMEAISHQLNQLGIQTELVLAESDATTALMVTRDYDLGYKGLSSFGYESWYGEYSSENVTISNIYPGNTAFDELHQQLLTTADAEERAAILEELQILEQQELLKLPLYTAQNYIYLNDKVVLPEDLEFGNPFYRFDFQFDEWEVR